MYGFDRDLFSRFSTAKMIAPKAFALFDLEKN